MDIDQRQNQHNLLKDQILSVRGRTFKGKLQNAVAICYDKKTGVGLAWGGAKQALGRSQEFCFGYVKSEMPHKWIHQGDSCIYKSGVGVWGWK